MPYLIKAVSTSGIVSWLTHPGLGGCRSLGPRSGAGVISSLEGARWAIAQMPWVFRHGIRFSVVETYEDGAEHGRDSVAELQACERVPDRRKIDANLMAQSR
jgi:hypothetical protein